MEQGLDNTMEFDESRFIVSPHRIGKGVMSSGIYWVLDLMRGSFFALKPLSRSEVWHEDLAIGGINEWVAHKAAVAINRRNMPPGSNYIADLEFDKLVHISDPNLVARLGCEYGIAQKYYPAGDLGEYLKTSNKTHPWEALWFTHDACVASEIVRQSGGVHFDIKPPNILVGEQRRLFQGESGGISVELESYGGALTDFGLAVQREDLMRCGYPGNSIIGTPFFIDPHVFCGQYRDNKPSPDAFAVGVTTGMVLNHRHPLVDHTNGQGVQQIFRKLRKLYRFRILVGIRDQRKINALKKSIDTNFEGLIDLPEIGNGGKLTQDRIDFVTNIVRAVDNLISVQMCILEQNKRTDARGVLVYINEIILKLDNLLPGGIQAYQNALLERGDLKLFEAIKKRLEDYHRLRADESRVRDLFGLSGTVIS